MDDDVKACFSGEGEKNKWLDTFKDTEIIGQGIKNKLVAGELIDEFGFPQEDKDKSGVITKEVLECYGREEIYLKKTSKTHKDEEGVDRDVGLISFPFSLGRP